MSILIEQVNDFRMNIEYLQVFDQLSLILTQNAFNVRMLNEKLRHFQLQHLYFLKCVIFLKNCLNIQKNL